MKLEKPALIKIAKEFNEVMGLKTEDGQPGIDPSWKAAVLEEKIIEAIEMIDPEEDEFTPETQAIIDYFNTSGELGIAEDEVEDQVAEEVEEVAVPAPKAKGKGKVVTMPKKAAPEPDPEDEEDEAPAPKAKTVTKDKSKRTKKAVVLELISKKTGASIEQIAQQIVDEGIDPDYKKNMVVVRLWLSKLGYKTNKDAIAKNPMFKAK